MAQDSPDLSMKFHEAQQFVRKIEEALREEDLLLDAEKKILSSAYGDQIKIY